jgi:hypothetical protein
MTSPLDLTGVVRPSVLAWVFAFIPALGIVASAKYRGWLPARPMLFAALLYACWGSGLTISNIALKANSLGHISDGLLFFMTAMAALPVACAGWVSRLATPPTTEGPS